ncbi:cell division protein ZipA C-terminal FtsZ-binding domain-containing protein [Methylococcus capsulatus]|uniref:cell division protein ZipA C-terminal FtsZ-binding domain-containing protein n=1 Tax=Methylococcus capsulatus TaxID=414 RepID=UPI001C52AB05|nr:cell division protein ZipA C-terminal FtsZ-binding domain-containing protein [Methylococcus capsulatus]QXP86988.1 cell division protein ZipA [Methylococcus capsulatus]QXP93332.1 cell division protein ZipA [Methylococcus capsulatus]UQN11969.1 cell division protein ZipA [Methylococcus capsulatus]
MDRDTVRIIILVAGALVIAGIYVWGRHKQKILAALERFGEFGVFEKEDEIGESRRPVRDTDHGFTGAANEPAAGEADAGGQVDELPREAVEEPPAGTSGALGAPFLIQLSVIKGGGGRFSGERLRDALIDLDLVYGEMGIFHRYDSAYREPLFSVASLVEPGTFPVNDMENFRTPGVVFFFQPAKVPDPLEVFDDLVDTCRGLAGALEGRVLDEHRAELTEARVIEMREILAEACEQS